MYLEPIFQAVRLAAVLCREVQRYHFTESRKVDDEPVTIADYGSQAIVLQAIHKHFPDDAVMAEESGRQFMDLCTPDQRERIAKLVSGVLGRSVYETDLAKWLDYNKKVDAARTWVIDPIDGTKGFLAQRHYVIAVGVLEDGRPTDAVIGAPAYPGYDRGALVYAYNAEAFIQPLMDENAPPPRRVSVTNTTDPAQIRVLESVEKSHASHDRMARVRELAGFGTSPLERVDSQEKYARIAAGDGELYLRLPRKFSSRPHSTWDHAAGAALIHAAGGKVTDVDGSPLDFTTGPTLANNQGMIVSNGAIHDRMVEAVMQVMGEEAEAEE
jgi:HAL2 family 3'(2'),5'-bisphosphate nucleotidase